MHVDAIVVGSGLCGTLAARHLEAAGQSVLVLEAGPPLPAGALPGDVAGFQRAVAPVVVAKEPLWAFRGPKGYEWHRVRAHGGRTLLWGGWMERPPRDYFDARERLGAPWPDHLTKLTPWVRRAEQVLSVRSGKSSALHRQLRTLGFSAGVKRECVMPGARRMLTAVDLPLAGKVRCDAPVLRLEAVPGGLVAHFSGSAPLSARRIILAASPIETARIVEASLAPSLRRTRFGVADHLIAGAIGIATRAPVTQHPVDAAESSAVIHPKPGSRARFTTEVRGPIPLEQLDAEDLAALGFTPEQAMKHSFFVVFAMGETDANLPRQVELGPKALDGLGRPMPRFVPRRHTDSERRLAQQMNERCLRIARQLAETRAQTFLIYDALDFSSGGHEVGTCLEKLDESGEVHELPGVFVADGAGVPAATDRHPSLTLAANALRVAEAARFSLAAG